MYAENLSASTVGTIIGNHCDELRAIGRDIDRPDRMQDAIALSLAFAQERALIANIQAGNWDAYKVVEEEAPLPEFIPDEAYIQAPKQEVLTR